MRVALILYSQMRTYKSCFQNLKNLFSRPGIGIEVDLHIVTYLQRGFSWSQLTCLDYIYPEEELRREISDQYRQDFRLETLTIFDQRDLGYICPIELSSPFYQQFPISVALNGVLGTQKYDYAIFFRPDVMYISEDRRSHGTFSFERLKEVEGVVLSPAEGSERERQGFRNVDFTFILSKEYFDIYREYFFRNFLERTNRGYLTTGEYYWHWFQVNYGIPVYPLTDYLKGEHRVYRTWVEEFLGIDLFSDKKLFAFIEHYGFLHENVQITQDLINELLEMYRKSEILLSQEEISNRYMHNT